MSAQLVIYLAIGVMIIISIAAAWIEIRATYAPPKGFSQGSTGVAPVPAGVAPEAPRRKSTEPAGATPAGTRPACAGRVLPV